MVKEERGQDNDRDKAHSVHIYIEVSVLILAVISAMVTVFASVYHEVNQIPYVTQNGLRIAQIIELFIIALASLGLVYKSSKLVTSFNQTKQAVRELTELSKIRETFIHMAQHRLKTPLSGVHWVLGALKSSTRLNEQELDMVHKGEEKMEMAEELVEKMMKLHKSDLSDFEFSNKKDDIDLSNLIQEIINDLDYLTHDKKTKVTFEPSVKAVIKGDRYLLKSGLTNVIDNAIRYSPEKTVTIMLQPIEAGVKIVIADTGVGMSSIDQKHIFEQFYRGKNARYIDPHQSGVGMYLTKQVVGLHGGNIEVSSVETEGTTFTITLPRE